MEDLKDIEQQQQFSSDDINNYGDDDDDQIEDDDDEEVMEAQEQMFLQQQMENEFINAGEDESDDGLVLAGGGTAASAYNQMMFSDPNLEMGFQQMQPPVTYTGWMQWYLSLEDHDFLVEVDREYINDKFNLIKLRDNFPTKDRFKECLRLILSSKVPNEEDLQSQQFLELNQDASDLYGLIHSRYVQSSTGLAKLYGKYLQGVFGNCPRALCDRQRTLPVGMSDKLRTSRVKVYCPRCEESYLPKYKNMNLDGSFFGTSLPHVFLKHYPLAIILPPKVYFYEPKIFGFRLFAKKGSKYNRPVKGNARFPEEEENLAQLTNQFKLNYSKQKEEFKSSQQVEEKKTGNNNNKSKKNKKKRKQQQLE